MRYDILHGSGSAVAQSNTYNLTGSSAGALLVAFARRVNYDVHSVLALPREFAEIG